MRVAVRSKPRSVGLPAPLAARSRDRPCRRAVHCVGYRTMEVDRRLESTERALHEREITFAALAKVAPVGIMRFDAAGACNYVNDRWTDITGLTIERAIGDGWQVAIHPDDVSTVV